MSELKNKFDELHRRVGMTSKARYSASRRLQFHNVMSQWTLTLITVGLIAVSVLAISSVKLNFQPAYVSVMQIVFSVLILAYSLLLSLGDYSARAVKIHRCGMELGKIAREIKPYLGRDHLESEYAQFVGEYYECLEKYENHEASDYLHASLSESWTSPVNQPLRQVVMGIFSREFTKLKYWITRYVPMTHYCAVLGMVYLWIFFLVK